ncbi:hypothetical protein CNQ84_14005 [Pseudomonas abyssi]|uniref:Uncharacterized protein n=1 Tax=Pseudomonas abyssi TaxID=170540 RepID=A0A2A3MFW0_9PSED|nr:STY4528 family pathogenicity island replication protein [Pseudomonas abyssi]PBK03683.1 hypothetical protein CNQ84_14005 [Pseudomonas abyssi]
MAMDDELSHRRSDSLANLLDGALSHLTTRQPSKTMDGLLYSGNRHESVPRRLFFDRRLTPLERNAWQVFRLQINDDGVTALPTYEQLRPWLASMPCGAQASPETVARALTLLRLTRWLSLVRRRRDAGSGRILGNLYVLHDEPLTPFEAMELDSGYLELVIQSLSHASKAVQVVGNNTLKEIADDPLLGGRPLPSRLQLLAERLNQGRTEQSDSYPQHSNSHESEDGYLNRLRNGGAPSSESEASMKPTAGAFLRNPKADSTVRSKSISKVRTESNGHSAAGVVLPERFRGLKDEQQAGALVALRQLDTPLQQAVLDEWVLRCDSSAIRNPAGYLFGIIQRAIRGEFNALAKQVEKPPAVCLPAEIPKQQEARNMVSPMQAKEYLNELRNLLHRD